MQRVRLYGVTGDNGSFARVTNGWLAGLTETNELAGFVDVCAYDPDEQPPGADALVGLYVGPPAGLDIMSQVGFHAVRYALIPPNSTFVPQSLLEHCSRNETRIVSPSQWGMVVLGDIDASIPVSVFPHGVDTEAFQPRDRETERRAYKKTGLFSVLHMSSTAAERKGTRELVAGWCAAVSQGLLGANPLLTLVLEAPPGFLRREIIDAAMGDEQIMNTITVEGRLNLSETQTAELYSLMHLVAQPSRGEGFGLVPLEALCCGVPVMVTCCTGHTEYIRADMPGVVEVPTGPLAPIDDGPGAMAPRLRAEDVAEALVRAYATLEQLDREATGNAQELRRLFGWGTLTKLWIAKESIGWTRKR